MKKIAKTVTATLICMTLLFSIAACGNGGQDTEERENYLVILVSSRLGDNSTSDAMNAGLVQAQLDFGFEYMFIEAPAEDPGRFPAAIAEAVEMNPDIIVTQSGSGMNDVAIASARENPDILYITLDAPITQEGIDDLDNWVGKMATQNEPSFLVGYLAALMTETNNISATVGVEYPVLMDFIVGYIHGAKYANPDITVQIGVIGDFLDQARAKEIGMSQAVLGADVLYAVAGPASFGILEAARDSNVWGIGVDVDMSLDFVGVDDAQANAIITSAIKDWGFLAYHGVDRIINGVPIAWGTVEIFDITNGGVTFIRNDIYLRTVPAEIQERMNVLEERMKNGDIVAPSFFLPDGTSMSIEDYEELKASVALGR